MRLLVLVVTALLVAGCATKYELTHPTANQQDRHRDYAECLALAQSGGNNPQIQYAGPQGSNFAGGLARGWNQGAAASAARQRNQIYEHCMLGRGYFYRERR